MDRYGRQLLADVVVQLAGNPHALDLLGIDQACEEVMDVLVAGTERHGASK